MSVNCFLAFNFKLQFCILFAIPQFQFKNLFLEFKMHALDILTPK